MFRLPPSLLAIDHLSHPSQSYHRMTYRPNPRATAQCAILLALALGAFPASAERSLGELTGPWQLFVDDYLVSSKLGVVRTYHPFKKHPGNPIIVSDQPWHINLSFIK